MGRLFWLISICLVLTWGCITLLGRLGWIVGMLGTVLLFRIGISSERRGK